MRRVTIPRVKITNRRSMREWSINLDREKYKGTDYDRVVVQGWVDVGPYSDLGEHSLFSLRYGREPGNDTYGSARIVVYSDELLVCGTNIKTPGDGLQDSRDTPEWTLGQGSVLIEFQYHCRGPGSGLDDGGKWDLEVTGGATLSTTGKCPDPYDKLRDVSPWRFSVGHELDDVTRLAISKGWYYGPWVIDFLESGEIPGEPPDKDSRPKFDSGAFE